MSGNKRYFWLKLDENFFEEDTIAWIEEQENGKEYIVFYLKLALKSLTGDGYLVRYVGERLIPYDVKALARLTNTDSDTVQVAMKLFLDIGLVSQLESGELYMTQIEEMVGSETESAKRVRKHRAKQNLLQSNAVLLQSNSDVIKSNTEKEKEKEKELDKEIDVDKEQKKPASKLSETQLRDDFEALWKLYPNKRGKQQAFKHYKKAIKDNVTNKEIQTGIVNYKKEIAIKGTAKTYIKAGNNWFRDYGWEDDFDFTPPRKQQYHKGSNHQEIIPSWMKEKETGVKQQEESATDAPSKEYDEDEMRRRINELIENE